MIKYDPWSFYRCHRGDKHTHLFTIHLWLLGDNKITCQLSSSCGAGLAGGISLSNLSKLINLSISTDILVLPPEDKSLWTPVFLLRSHQSSANSKHLEPVTRILNTSPVIYLGSFLCSSFLNKLRIKTLTSQNCGPD